MNSLEDPYSYFIGRFEAAKKEGKDIITPLDEQTFRRRPSSKAWCIGECFSHMVEAGMEYYKPVKKGVSSAGPQEEKPKNPMHLRFHLRWFVNYLEPPVFFKTKAPASFKPIRYAQLNKKEVLNDFLLLQDRYISAVEQARTKNLDLSGIYVSHPLISFVSLSVAECIAVTEAHQRRHTRQALHTLSLLT